ncbi:type III-B CRISPR module-associated Cmr3 family protein [Synechococcus elongatus IITB4]|uniref:type III-B CRISPR module-associated Cmr3 family protein n=1 Tax=Synechococcus elongatus TaxID=32046 RepID=UPI0030CEF331
MFNQLVIIKPLGLLYGSSGRFLSPENLVGRSGEQFPPPATTLAGLFAAALGADGCRDIEIAGPFWASDTDPQNFRVPLPLTLRVAQGKIQSRATWSDSTQDWQTETQGPGKAEEGGWVAIADWDRPNQVESSPWTFTPHLHPRMEIQQRCVKADERGSLFLEHAVALHPEVSLIYLADRSIPNGWYRFGGEGHMVDVRCEPLAATTQTRLKAEPGRALALITPAVWGSTRFSYREPMLAQPGEPQPAWPTQALITGRARPFRYRLGGSGTGRRLSRGRYAVPAGTVYVLREPLTQPWVDWPETWFPREGLSFKRWGLGLALPLPAAIA